MKSARAARARARAAKNEAEFCLGEDAEDPELQVAMDESRRAMKDESRRRELEGQRQLELGMEHIQLLDDTDTGIDPDHSQKVKEPEEEEQRQRQLLRLEQQKQNLVQKKQQESENEANQNISDICCQQCGSKAEIKLEFPQLNKSCDVCSESCGEKYQRFLAKLNAPFALHNSHWDGLGSDQKFVVTATTISNVFKASLLPATQSEPFYPVLIQVDGDEATIVFHSGEVVPKGGGQIDGDFNDLRIDWWPGKSKVTWVRSISGVYTSVEKQVMDIVVQQERFASGHSPLLTRFDQALNSRQADALRHVLEEASERKAAMDDSALSNYGEWANQLVVAAGNTEDEENLEEIFALARSRANLEDGRRAGPHVQYEQLDDYMVGGGLHALGGKLGLNNIGNTCYMASGVQCIMHTTPLVEYMLAGRHFAEVNRANRLGQRGRMVTAFSNLLHANFNCSNCEELPPTELKQAVVRTNPQFEGNAMHDVQELVMTILDGLHEDLNRVKGGKPLVENPEYTSTSGKTAREVAKDAWKGYLLRDKSVIVDIFGGQDKTTLKCQTCSYTKASFQTSQYLSLSLNGVERRPKKPPQLDENGHPMLTGTWLQETNTKFNGINRTSRVKLKCTALEGGCYEVDIAIGTNGFYPVVAKAKPDGSVSITHSKGELLDKPVWGRVDNTRNCITWGANLVWERQIVQQVHLEDCIRQHCSPSDVEWRCPNCEEDRIVTSKCEPYVLPQVLIVQLKRFEHDAYGRPFKVNQDVTFPHELEWPTAASSDSYSLYAVSNHHGSLNGGHYTAYAKQQAQGQWFKFNDELVTPVEPGEVVNQAAYLLFYQRNDLAPSTLSSASAPAGAPLGKRGWLVRQQTLSSEVNLPVRFSLDEESSDDDARSGESSSGESRSDSDSDEEEKEQVEEENGVLLVTNKPPLQRHSSLAEKDGSESFSLRSPVLPSRYNSSPAQLDCSIVKGPLDRPAVLDRQFSIESSDEEDDNRPIAELTDDLPPVPPSLTSRAPIIWTGVGDVREGDTVEVSLDPSTSHECVTLFADEGSAAAKAFESGIENYIGNGAAGLLGALGVGLAGIYILTDFKKNGQNVYKHTSVPESMPAKQQDKYIWLAPNMGEWLVGWYGNLGTETAQMRFDHPELLEEGECDWQVYDQNKFKPLDGMRAVEGNWEFRTVQRVVRNATGRPVTLELAASAPIDTPVVENLHFFPDMTKKSRETLLELDPILVQLAYAYNTVGKGGEPNEEDIKNWIEGNSNSKIPIRPQETVGIFASALNTTGTRKCQVPKAAAEPWACPTCTFENTKSASICKMCYQAKEKRSDGDSMMLDADDRDDHYNGTATASPRPGVGHLLDGLPANTHQRWPSNDSDQAVVDDDEYKYPSPSSDDGDVLDGEWM
jgi:ubiquitin C-terminal hydrolase